ncbi:MAG: hypothetical protein QOG65_3413 [Actinomycetota bacterium]|jgi:hypothetical protein|nr:hypothetical protein [Actinomycetota bacterium]
MRERFGSGCVALAIVAYLLAPSAAVASNPSAGKTIVVRESGFESFIGNTNVSGLVHAVVRGFGAATDTATFGACVNPSSTVCADNALKFHNGDTLRWHDEGTLVQMSGPPFPEVGHINRFSDVLTVTGGTGRFAGATGQLIATESSEIIVSDPNTSFVKKLVSERAAGTIIVLHPRHQGV